MTINNGSVVNYQTLQNDTLSGFNSSTRPTVSATYVRLKSDNSWVSGDSGGSIEANRDTNIVILFSEAMDNSSITVNTSDTDCSGTIQVSKEDTNTDFFEDGFCVQMSSSPSASNNNKTFTLDPSGRLTKGVVYKIRVTTGVKDGSGNSLNCLNSCTGSNYQTPNGFGIEK
jgi:hypothetical protein